MSAPTITDDAQQGVEDGRPGAAKARRNRTSSGATGLRLYTWLVIAWLSLPILVMVLFGFNDTSGKFNFVWQGWTLRWYRELFDINDLTTALRNSITIAVIVTGLLSLFLTLGIPRGYWTVVIAHIMFDIVYVAITVQARMSAYDRSLEEAAKDLGASAFTTFRLVTLPILMPGVIAGSLLAFALSIDDFIITEFNAGSMQTFPLWVYGSSRVGTPPQVNVMGTLVFAFGIALVLLNTAMLRRQRRRTSRTA
jgi:spermidine/putrescine transport system permease protein